ncbi:PP2C family protein-serine/threonine phosphatase [Streptomyces sp. CRN 30]|uniref:PP2C family protein-serine/threonine phosphatase n=1 Tax=Streptomyces sp. CRN 30 TaxID=3075613 RepID=UPI002A83BE4B|nr:PP2C family protein-serine/threonine phosphatase [Streptomyces sp. CRN 30]
MLTASRAGTRLRTALEGKDHHADRRPARVALALGLPTAWGATALTYKLVCPLAQQDGFGARIVTGAVFFAVGTGLMLHVRWALLRELRQARRTAGAVRSALLRPLPARIGGLATAAVQLSADRAAAVGGDLYEVIATDKGVRVVMGDVRGHGPAAIGTVAAVLGCFREAVHDEAELAWVLRRLDRALARHLRERARSQSPVPGAHPEGGPAPDSPVAEEFVTVLLLEIRRDGEVLALNCGHPWPYLLTADGGVRLLCDAEPLPPLGPFPLPAELPATDCGSLLPGEALFLHTDGVQDARDAHGRFFALPAVLAEAVRTRPLTARSVLRAVFAQLLRHTRGRPADDVTLLVLGNDGCRVGHQPGPAVARPVT